MKQGNVVERSELVIASEVIAVCSHSSLSLDKITKKIYSNSMVKNRFRVFQVIEALLKHGVLVPQFKNNCLCFRFNNGDK